MIFLTVIAWIVFVILTLVFLAIIVVEGTKSKKDRELEELLHQLGDMIGKPSRRTYWNYRMYMAVALWLASGTFIFW